MARGPKKHLKRLNAPKHWMLSKLGGIWAPRPSTGPHKLRESIPLVILLRNRLKYALTRREVLMIVARRLVKVDHKVRTEMNYPAGFMDVVSLDAADEHFRLLYDVKGRFSLVRLKAESEELKFKLCRVKKVAKGGAGSHGRNPLSGGQGSSIPYLTTNDGRTVRYPDPDIAVHDTIKLDIATNKILAFYKFTPGNLVMVTKGNNIGRVGTLLSRERHVGSFDIAHVEDKTGAKFATRIENVFVIGTDKPAVTLPKGKGIRLSIQEERDRAVKKEAERAKGK